MDRLTKILERKENWSLLSEASGDRVSYFQQKILPSILEVALQTSLINIRVLEEIKEDFVTAINNLKPEDLTPVLLDTLQNGVMDWLTQVKTVLPNLVVGEQAANFIPEQSDIDDIDDDRLFIRPLFQEMVERQAIDKWDRQTRLSQKAKMLGVVPSYSELRMLFLLDVLLREDSPNGVIIQ